MQIRELPLGHKWLREYTAFCLGHNLATAGALELAYRLGRAHDDFERLRLGVSAYSHRIYG